MKRILSLFILPAVCAAATSAMAGIQTGPFSSVSSPGGNETWTNITVLSGSSAIGSAAYVTQGSPTVTYGTNSITVTGGSDGNFDDYLVNTNWPTVSHNWTATFQMWFTTAGAGSGFGFGMRSGDIASENDDLFFLLVDAYVQVWYGAPGSPTMVGQSGPRSAWTIPRGDLLDCELVRRDQNFFFSVSNTVNGEFTQYTWHYPTDVSSDTNGFEASCIGHWAWWASGNADTTVITNFTFTEDGWTPRLLNLVGDSITSGYGVEDSEMAWGNRMQAAYGKGVGIYAADSATVTDLVTALPCINLFPATNTLILAGVNDMGRNDTLATFTNHYMTLVAGITNGSTIWYGLLPPQNHRGTGFSADICNEWIMTNYAASGHVIDFYNPLKDGTTNEEVEYIYDGTHPNWIGQGVMFKIAYQRLMGITPQ